jgi:DNA-binding transcriptional LysR family regulator
MAESHLAVRGVRPRFVFRTNDNGTVQAMVAAGIGVAMVPLLTTDEQDARTEVVELREPIPPRRLAIVRHRDRYRTPASVAFEDLAAEVASRVEARETEFLAGQRTGARR